MRTCSVHATACVPCHRGGDSTRYVALRPQWQPHHRRASTANGDTPRYSSEQTCTRMRVRMETRTHALTHTHAHTHTFTYIHIHMHVHIRVHGHRCEAPSCRNPCLQHGPRSCRRVRPRRLTLLLFSKMPVSQPETRLLSVPCLHCKLPLLTLMA